MVTQVGVVLPLGQPPGARAFSQGRSHCLSLRGTGCWQGCNPAACGELVWGGSCSSKEQFSLRLRQLWCAPEQAFVHLNFPRKSFLQYEETPNVMYRDLCTKGKPF